MFRIALVDGSSPRVRGTARTNILEANSMRFIPAGAGNRQVYRGAVVSDAVHPRGCGEQRVAR